MSKQFENLNGDLELKLEPMSMGTDETPAFADDYRSIKGKRLLILIGSVVAFGIIAYILTRFLSHDATHAPSTSAVAHQEVSHSYNSVMVDFPEIVTNLASTNDKESYIKLSITLELNEAKDQDAVDKKLYMMRDSIIIFLRELRAADLTSSGGSMMLKTEIIKRLNKILYPIEIKDILFKEVFVNQ